MYIGVELLSNFVHKNPSIFFSHKEIQIGVEKTFQLNSL